MYLTLRAAGKGRRAGRRDLQVSEARTGPSGILVKWPVALELHAGMAVFAVDFILLVTLVALGAVSPHGLVVVVRIGVHILCLFGHIPD